jgi:polyphosphate kinase
MKPSEIPLIHRDISWLNFNYRVLQEAKDPSVPLLERIKFLGIYSSNLDEFFRVRVASLRSLLRLSKKTKRQIEFSPEDVLQEISHIVQLQQMEFSEIFQKQILPELQACGIHIRRLHELTPNQTQYIEKLFEEGLIQYLQPMLIIKNKIRTFLISNTLYLAVILQTKGENNRYALVKIPTHKVSRFVLLPSEQENIKELILLDDVVRYFLRFLFPGYNVWASYSIKMTRDADIHIDDEYTGNLVEKIKRSISKRNIGPTTRFVYDRKMPENCLQFLMDALNIQPKDLQPEGRYHNNFDFLKFPDFGLNQLKNAPMPALPHSGLEAYPRLIEAIQAKDHLVHYPYQKYDYVLHFLQQAAYDPSVTEIRITQYRVAKDSQIMAALRSALQMGKRVTVFVEVKARFDEEANLYWAERLEQWGAKVLYSLPELKVHAKLLLIARQEEERTVDYCYLSTGNFNESTAHIYGDYGFFTKDERLTQEVRYIFDYLENPTSRPNLRFKHLMVGQFRMRRDIYDLISQEMAFAQQGKPASITVKLNSIQDPGMISRLYEASKAGVKIRMIVRGICCLVPGFKDFSENIEVISIVDRFLEHSRVYMFEHGGEEKIYLSSADWMTRNLYHRIECAFPIYDPKLKGEIKHFIECQWRDNSKARQIDEAQTNRYRRNDQAPHRCQMAMYEYYKNS